MFTDDYKLCWIVLLCWVSTAITRMDIYSSSFRQTDKTFCDAYTTDLHSSIKSQNACLRRCLMKKTACVGFCYNLEEQTCTLYGYPETGNHSVVNFDYHSYFYANVSLVMTEAMTYCEQHNSSLAAPMTLAEAHYMKNRATGLYVGFKRKYETQEFKRIYDDEILPSGGDWQPGRPVFGNKYCVVINSEGYKDLSCFEERPFYCQRPSIDTCTDLPLETTRNSPSDTQCYVQKGH